MERLENRSKHVEANAPSIETESLDTVVIGGGQAGLSVGRRLQSKGVSFVILDGEQRTGDVWRRRWDSLRLFTPAKFSSLDGMRYPGSPDHFPTKDEFADYLESYASKYALPIRHGSRVDRLTREGDRFVMYIGRRRITAKQVVVAMANYQRPQVPAFAAELDPGIVQLHSSEYRNPDQLPADGAVLVVGSGNSGAEIALELSKRQPVWLAGRYPGHLPFTVDSPAGRAVLGRLVLRGLFHRVLTVDTPIGRRVRPKVTRGSGPLIRTKAKHLAAAGVRRLPAVTGSSDGRPLCADGRELDVSAVVWCTGFRPGFEWLDLPLRFEGHEPAHERGLVKELPGLYFVGLHFLYSLSSSMIHGVGRDAERVAASIAARVARREKPRHTQADGRPVVEATEPAATPLANELARQPHLRNSTQGPPAR